MILAVDPGIATCGWAVVVPNSGEIVELGVVICPHDPDVDDTTDRARRLAEQSDALRRLSHRHRVTTIAAEAVSLGGPPKARLAMGMCLCLSWGGLVALALELGAALLEIRPKQWQHAIQPGAKRVDYDKLFASLVAYILRAPGHEHVAEQLRAIHEDDRNHALDACGIGMFCALRPHEATRIIKRKDLAA